MDVYYPPWPCNRSDGENMSNQIFAQQALGGFSNNNEGGEPHTMPIPSGQPWNIQAMPWGASSPQPQIMQFTAQTGSGCPMQESPRSLLHCKRKPTDSEPPIPAKQFITEEKMAAHLNNLHISSDYVPHESTEETMDVFSGYDQPITSIGDQLKGKTLVFCDELKKLQSEPLLPPALIERLEKPCMSLVVWKPKEPIGEKFKNDKDDTKERNPSKVTQRTNVLITPDHNTFMDIEMR